MTKDRKTYFQYLYCWNGEQRFLFDNRKTLEGQVDFFFHVIKYWEEDEILEFYQEEGMLGLFAQLKEKIFNEGKIDYFKINKTFIVGNKLLKLFGEKEIKTLFKENKKENGKKLELRIETLNKEINKDREEAFKLAIDKLKKIKDNNKKNYIKETLIKVFPEFAFQIS